MLHRVLEPEVMDAPEEALAYDAMDHSEVNRAFVDDALEAYRKKGRHAEGEFLDLGTGTAQIPVELCERVSDVRVLAIDRSISMLDIAKANVEVAGLRGQIMLDAEDAKQLSFEDGRFDAVISNSIVHHLPQPAIALAEAWRVLRSDGLMFVRDLLRPVDDAGVTHLVETYAADATEHQRQMFDDSLRAALSLEEIRQLVAAMNIDPETAVLTSDRHWTWCCWKEESIGVGV